MTESDIDKLTDELIDARAELDHYQNRSIMHLRRYYEVASALGFNLKTGGYPAHADVLARAKELSIFARVG